MPTSMHDTLRYISLLLWLVFLVLIIRANKTENLNQVWFYSFLYGRRVGGKRTLNFTCYQDGSAHRERVMPSYWAQFWAKTWVGYSSMWGISNSLRLVHGIHFNLRQAAIDTWGTYWGLHTEGSRQYPKSYIELLPTISAIRNRHVCHDWEWIPRVYLAVTFIGSPDTWMNAFTYHPT